MLNLSHLFRLQVSILPMLLHLHQCQLDFLIAFFGAKSSSIDHSTGQHKDSCSPKFSVTKSKNVAGNTIPDEALLPYFQASDVVLKFFKLMFHCIIFSVIPLDFQFINNYIKSFSA